MDEASLIENTVFSESAINGASKACAKRFSIQGAGNVALVEEGDDLVFEMLACGEL